MCSDLAVKWLSLISIKSEQVSKICSMVKHLSHPMHIGGSSPFSEKEWVIKEWPMCSRAVTISSFLFVRGQTMHSFNTGNILYNLISGNSSHSDCHSSNIYLFVRGFRSENGMSSTEMSPSRAYLAAESAAEFSVMQIIIVLHQCRYNRQRRDNTSSEWLCFPIQVSTTTSMARVPTTLTFCWTRARRCRSSQSLRLSPPLWFWLLPGTVSDRAGTDLSTSTPTRWVTL